MHKFTHTHPHMVQVSAHTHAGALLYTHRFMHQCTDNPHTWIHVLKHTLPTLTQDRLKCALADTYMYMSPATHTGVHISTHRHIGLHMLRHVHTGILASAYTYTHTQVHTLTHIPPYSWVHIHTLTHTFPTDIQDRLNMHRQGHTHHGC